MRRRPVSQPLIQEDAHRLERMPAGHERSSVFDQQNVDEVREMVSRRLRIDRAALDGMVGKARELDGVLP